MPEVVAIDAHHHFWNYDPVDYAWIGDHMSVLKRNYQPRDLKNEMDAVGVSGAVSVQARQTLQETAWLLDLAARNDFLKGVVGWAPLIDPAVTAHLERLALTGKLKAVRHVLQDEPDDNYMLRADFQEGIRRLRAFSLAYDILIYEKHLPQTIQFVDRHPNQIFILDHIGKPRIKDRAMSPWRENILDLALRENVYCKVSGMATEADWSGWNGDGLKPYFDVVIEAFEPRRLMFGTDWPLLELAGSYEKWTSLVRRWIAPLSRDEQNRLLRGTAIEAYCL